jgi:lysophospholipase L1-like esterase
MASRLLLLAAGVCLLAASPASWRPAPRYESAANGTWAATWSAPAHGPYPAGNATAGPDLQFALPDPAVGATNQTFRLMVRPGLWGSRLRFRFANTFGSRPVTLDGVFVGLQASGGRVARGTTRAARFGGHEAITLRPGERAWSDEVSLDFFDAARAGFFDGRRIAVSFHVVGASGPITWHAKALTTSYLSPPDSGSHGSEEGDGSFPYSAASWFFLDAVDVLAPAGTKVIAAFGDSITDGTATTMNGDDRWPDLLAARLNATGATRWVVVNQGIGGNRVTGPEQYSARRPFAGGPSAVERLDPDVLALSGLTAIVWLEGINDLARGEITADAVMAGMRDVVRRVRERGGVRIYGATLTSSLGSTSGEYGTPEVDRKRRALNAFIRTSGIFDAVFDFDAATTDPATGRLRPQFEPNSTSGGPGDRLHPNRAGQMAMAAAIDLSVFSR